MKNPEFHIAPKKTEDLEKQVQETNDFLMDQHVEPRSMGEDIFRLTGEELKERYPKRYEIYLNLLREQRRKTPILEGEDLERMSKWLYILNSLDNYIDRHQKAENKDQTLYEKQLTVFEDLRNFLEKGGTEGYVKLPTGTGKTVIFSEFIEAMGLRSLIAVPKKILVEQTKDAISKFSEDLDVGRIYNEAQEHGRQVTIITYQSLINKIQNGQIRPSDYDVVILDEAHKALGYHTKEAVGKLRDVIKIGFTATHQFSEKKSISSILKNEIHNMSIHEAVSEGLLSSYQVVLIESNTDISDVKVMSTGDYDQDELETTLNIEAENQESVDIYRNMFPGRKAIFYCTGIQHSKDLAASLQKAGVKAEAIYGGQKIAGQMEIKRKFQTGEIMVLCNTDILIEGFDEPSASVCINLRPTLSRVVAEQRGGRVLRLDPANPNKHALIVDFIYPTRKSKQAPIVFAEVSGASYASSKKDTPASIETSGLDPEIKVVSDPIQVKEYAERIMRERKEEAPEGWINIMELAKGSNVRPMVMRDAVRRLKPEYPEEYSSYLDMDKHHREFYSPKFQRALREEVRAKEVAPEGWYTASQLAYDFKRKHQEVVKVANKLGLDHPEWFKKYMTRSQSFNFGFPEEHFAPELVELLKRHFYLKN